MHCRRNQRVPITLERADHRVDEQLAKPTQGDRGHHGTIALSDDAFPLPLGEAFLQKKPQPKVEILELLIDLKIKAAPFEERKSHELWLIEGKNDHAAHVLLELRARTSLFVPKINPFNAGADALKELIKQRLEDRALIPKVEIEGATRDGDPFGDVVDGGLEIALLSKDVEGGVEDLTPPHRPSIRCPHPSSLTHVPARRIGFIDRSEGELIFRDIAEVRPEPTLNLRDTHALSLRIFLNLI